ncbi:hypothetical protein IHN63_00305 [Deinococcus sp. 6YEL10]|uniref:hypothetical protein n=1 Tax=Deinococcus sp. 6YEL10 TaxID=2745870 RepID=UPI001E493B1D|nr:hypothetical protein [Deinococcus sp. 6YEL10]MCD0159740.1 hypothetical protein [Deinococcus sp. 6YEL10]
MTTKTTRPQSVDAAGVSTGRTSAAPGDSNSKLDSLSTAASWRQVIPVLRLLAMGHEEARAYVHDIVDLGGATGFHVEIRGGSDRTIQRASERLNDFAHRINPDRGGLQYALHNQFRELAITGALSMETWINDERTAVQDIAHVPREEVYARYDPSIGRFRFYQRPSNYRVIGSDFDYSKGIPLPLMTYRHGLFEGQGDSADPVPPLFSIIDALKQNQDAYASLSRILKTMGLYGAVIGKVDRPDPTQFDDGVNDPQYGAEIERRIEHMVDVMKKGAKDAMYVYAVDPQNFDNDMIDVKNIGSAGAQNADSITKQIKNRVSTGTSVPGFLHGNPEGISDAYMRVIYPRVLDHIGRFRHIVGAAFEQTVALDMRLGGIPIQSVNWQWNAQKNGYEDRDANARRLDAQADMTLYQLYGEAAIPQLAARNGVSAEELRRSMKGSFLERQLALQQQQAEQAPTQPKGDTPTAQGETSTDKPRQDRPAKVARFSWNKDTSSFRHEPDRLVIY